MAEPFENQEGPGSKSATELEMRIAEPARVCRWNGWRSARTAGSGPRPKAIASRSTNSAASSISSEKPLVVSTDVAPVL
jgi:hypothetical protein